MLAEIRGKSMTKVAIIGNGPSHLIPELSIYQNEIDIWIGADRGALSIIKQNMELAYAVGDFDSVNDDELEVIRKHAIQFEQYQVEKDETDLELALNIAKSIHPSNIFFFGVTGGRLDHTLINIQLLDQLVKEKMTGVIIDRFNYLELHYPGSYSIVEMKDYPTISFIPITQEVSGLTLLGFYYPLTKATIKMGSTLSISNKLILNNGTFSFDDGIVLVIRSRD